jgi:hypothetical protein
VIKIGKSIVDSAGKFAYAILFCILTLISVLSFAEVKVQATVPENEIGVGDTVVVTVSVSSDASFDASEPTPPPVDGFNLVNSWNSSSTSSRLMQTPSGMQFQTVRKQDFNFMFSPAHVGNFQIPAFQVSVDGKNYSTKPIKMHVAGQGSGAGTQQQVPGMPDLDDIDQADQMFQQLLQRGRNTAPPPANKMDAHNPNESFFVQAEVDKTTAYEGEQITASWYIYTRGNMLSLDRLKFPDLKGFWKEIIEEVPALNFTQEVVNGVPYRRALLATHALFPIKSGTAVIDEYKIKASMQSLQGPFGFGPAYTYTRSSERIPITVKPLPTEGKPKDFTGAVGQFEMKSSIDGQSFPANQPFSLKVRFDGSGNAKSIELPPLSLPPGLEVYDTKNESKFFKNGRSYKEFEVLIIPRQEGAMTIPALSASMFDPKTGKYYTRTSPAISVKITAAVNGTGPVGTRLQSPAATPELNKNELPPVLMTWDAGQHSSKAWTLYAQILLWLIVILALIWKAKKEFSIERVRNIRAEFNKRLKHVHQVFEQGDWRKVGTEVSNLIYFVLGETSGQGGANQEASKLLDLSPPSVRRELGKDLQKHIDFFQVVGFAPEEAVGKYREISELKKEFQQTVKTLEKALDLAKRTE